MTETLEDFGERMKHVPFQDRFKELEPIERLYALLVYQHDLGKTKMFSPGIEMDLELVLETEQVNRVLIVARTEWEPE